MTQYLLPDWHDDDYEVDFSSDDVRRTVAQVDAFNEKLTSVGAWVFAGGLQPATSATLLQVSGGEISMTDGPFAETREQMGGFWIIGADDFDTALDWGSRTLAGRSVQQSDPVQPGHDPMNREWGAPPRSMPLPGGGPAVPSGHASTASDLECRWIVWTITIVVGLFVTVVSAAWTWSHVVRSEPIDAVARIILYATLLRVATIIVAWAPRTSWGRSLPGGPLVAALWGCASAQLTYPAAELIVKLLVVVDLVPSGTGGVRNMSVIGWFNFAAAALVFGLPGTLFGLLGHRVRAHRNVRSRWAWAGAAGGIVALCFIGVLIGS